MNPKQMLFVVLAVSICCALSGCGGGDDDDDDDAGVEEFYFSNIMVIPVTGVRIDGVDIGLELKPGETKRVPMTWEPGIHTFSIRFTPPDEEGATPLWTEPHKFKTSADRSIRNLFIDVDIEDRIDAERFSKWATHRFEKWKYSVDLPGEPNVKMQGEVVMTGKRNISLEIICSKTRLKTLGEAVGSTEQIDKNGFPAIISRSSQGNYVVHRLKVLAHGNVYNLVLTGTAEEVEKYSGKFFDSFTIDPE